MPAERLQKVLAAAGVASRRAARVDDRGGPRDRRRQARDASARRSTRIASIIAVDGRIIGAAAAHGLPAAAQAGRRHLDHARPPRRARPCSTSSRPRSCPTARGSTRSGRLDQDSEGMLLLTNDGEWADRVLHPRHGVEREYAIGARDGRSTASRSTRCRPGSRSTKGSPRSARLRPMTAIEVERLGRPAPTDARTGPRLVPRDPDPGLEAAAAADVRRRRGAGPAPGPRADRPGPHRRPAQRRRPPAQGARDPRPGRRRGHSRSARRSATSTQRGSDAEPADGLPPAAPRRRQRVGPGLGAVRHGQGRTSAFIDAVAADLRRRGLTVEIGDGVVLARQPGADEPHQLGLVQPLAAVPRRRPRRLVAHHRVAFHEPVLDAGPRPRRARGRLRPGQADPARPPHAGRVDGRGRAAAVRHAPRRAGHPGRPRVRLPGFDGDGRRRPSRRLAGRRGRGRSSRRSTTSPSRTDAARTTRSRPRTRA